MGAAIGAATGALAGFVRGLFGMSEGRKELVAANADIKKLQDELLKTYGSLDNIRTMGGAAGAALAGAWGDQNQAGLAHFKGLLGEFNAEMEHTKAITDLYNELIGTDQIAAIVNLEEAWRKLTPEQLANQHIMENLVTKYEALRDETGVIIPGLEEMA